MNRRYTAVSFSLIFFGILVSNCAQPTIAKPILSPTSTVLLPSSVAPTQSFTPLAPASPTLIFTPTMVPTLPVEDAQTKLLELLSDNGGCHLPCLWGITLGETTSYEAQATLMPLTSISELTNFTAETGAIFPVYTEGGLQIYTNVGFIADAENKIVDHIAFNAEAHNLLEQGGYEDVFDSKIFDERVSSYTLAHVLSEQGVPSSVMLATFGGPLTRGSKGGFDILLLYPDQGVLVNYRTQMHLMGSTVRGCPANAYIQMELYPPGKPNAFLEGLKHTDWVVKLNDYKPLDEVTPMTIQEFYDLFRQPTDKCIDTLAKLWPIPEQ